MRLSSMIGLTRLSERRRCSGGSVAIRRVARPPPPPAPPSSRTAPCSDGPLTLTLRGKAVDDLEAQQERTRPQLSHRAWKTGEQMPVSHSANRPRRFVVGWSWLFLDERRTAQLGSIEDTWGW